MTEMKIIKWFKVADMDDGPCDVTDWLIGYSGTSSKWIETFTKNFEPFRRMQDERCWRFNVKGFGLPVRCLCLCLSHWRQHQHRLWLRIEILCATVIDYNIFWGWKLLNRTRLNESRRKGFTVNFPWLIMGTMILFLGLNIYAVTKSEFESRSLGLHWLTFSDGATYLFWRL